MPAIQSTFTSRPTIAVVGQIADETDRVIVTRFVEEAGGIAFGRAVCVGVADHGVRLAAAGRVFEGVTVIDRSVPALSVNTNPIHNPAPIMLKGCVAVLAEEPVVAGADAFVDAATGGFTDSAAGNIAIPGGRFETSGGTGAIVFLRIR